MSGVSIKKKTVIYALGTPMCMGSSKFIFFTFYPRPTVMQSVVPSSCILLPYYCSAVKFSSVWSPILIGLLTAFCSIVVLDFFCQINVLTPTFVQCLLRLSVHPTVFNSFWQWRPEILGNLVPCYLFLPKLPPFLCHRLRSPYL